MFVLPDPVHELFPCPVLWREGRKTLGEKHHDWPPFSVDIVMYSPGESSIEVVLPE